MTTTTEPRLVHLVLAAQENGVHPNTLRAEVKAGRLPAFMLPGRKKGPMYVRRADVEALFVPVQPKDIDAD